VPSTRRMFFWIGGDSRFVFVSITVRYLACGCAAGVSPSAPRRPSTTARPGARTRR
jgi:hypothetical protein